MSTDRATRHTLAEQDESYLEALRQLRADQQHPPLMVVLRNAVHAACDAMAGEAVGRRVDDHWDGGLNCVEIGVPDSGLEDVTVDVVVPDLDTVTWNWVETLDSGTQVGTVEAEATMSFAGYLIDRYGCDDGTNAGGDDTNCGDSVKGGDKATGDDTAAPVADRTEKVSQVWLSRTARLRWQVTVDPGQTPELEFEGALAMPGQRASD